MEARERNVMGTVDGAKPELRRAVHYPPIVPLIEFVRA